MIYQRTPSNHSGATRQIKPKAENKSTGQATHRSDLFPSLFPPIFNSDGPSRISAPSMAKYHAILHFPLCPLPVAFHSQ